MRSEDVSVAGEELAGVVPAGTASGVELAGVVPAGTASGGTAILPVVVLGYFSRSWCSVRHTCTKAFLTFCSSE